MTSTISFSFPFSRPHVGLFTNKTTQNFNSEQRCLEFLICLENRNWKAGSPASFLTDVTDSYDCSPSCRFLMSGHKTCGLVVYLPSEFYFYSLSVSNKDKRTYSTQSFFGLSKSSALQWFVDTVLWKYFYFICLQTCLSGHNITLAYSVNTTWNNSTLSIPLVRCTACNIIYSTT